MTDQPSDLPNRLRRGSRADLRRVCHEAADEIERLRAVIRVNALRHNPSITHKQIDEVIHGGR